MSALLQYSKLPCLGSADLDWFVSYKPPVEPQCNITYVLSILTYNLTQMQTGLKVLQLPYDRYNLTCKADYHKLSRPIVAYVPYRYKSQLL